MANYPPVFNRQVLPVGKNSRYQVFAIYAGLMLNTGVTTSFNRA